jgi:N-methylhydantoinase B
MTGSSRVDVVTLEVIRHMLPAIANEMSYVLQRASFNMMIYEVRDYCCALLDTQGRLLSQNTGGVSHFVADLGVVIRDGVSRYGADGFRRGDVLITNHQRVAGQHLNNVMIYTPCFQGDRLVAFAANRAHWVDVGGLSTGFGAGSAVDPWAEGLQLDQIKLYEEGRLDEKMWRVIRDNIRYPESSMGDLRSQVAACRLGERRLAEVLDRYGREVVEEAIEIVLDQAEARCRALVASLPDGVYAAEARLAGHHLDGDEPVEIKVEVTIDGSDLTVDLTGCSLQRRAPINGRTLAAAVIAFKAITTPDAPINEGTLRALDIEIQEGNFMMATFPAAMAAWGRALPTVVDTILKALAPALPDSVPAAHLGVLGGPIIFFGVDPSTGARFVTQSIEGGGWGARAGADGQSGAVSVCQGDVRNAPIEKMELRWPVWVKRRELRRDSGGPGTFRGGLGIETQVEGLVPGRWTLADMGRRAFPPWGLDGGRPGRASDTRLRLPHEAEFRHVELIRAEVPAHAEAIVATAGGGGWGDPYDRDPARVLEDVRDGIVSIDGARRDYGVVIEPDAMQIDREATEEVRRGREQDAANEPSR